MNWKEKLLESLKINTPKELDKKILEAIKPILAKYRDQSLKKIREKQRPESAPDLDAGL